MKFPLINIYRAVTAMLVVLFHITSNTPEYYKGVFLNNFFGFGDFRVGFFFVLSGFMITYIHYNDIVNRSNFIEYVKKRLIRILPLYWLFATISLLSYFLFFHGYVNSIHTTLKLNSSADLLYILRCYLLIPGDKKFFVQVAWTLTYEILFYQVFSMCILGGIKIAKIIFFSWILIILFNKFIFHFGGFFDVITNFYILDILSGCLLACLFLKDFSISNKKLKHLITVSLFLSVLLYRIAPNLFNPSNIFSYLILSLNACLIILYCTKFDKINTNNFIIKAAMLIGKSSFSIYLSHLLFLAGLRSVFGKYIISMHIVSWELNIYLFIVFAMVILCGIVLHLLVEKPLIKKFTTRYVRVKVLHKKTNHMKRIIAVS